ncbi:MULTISPECIES: hypothetical protein [Mesorhizobium]|uniref:hypothetical protein n=1 Tax=Mesorhizobium TaxID=68287 RepID=UPI0012EB114C|nr:MULTISPECIES: hypothetical protein [Mesorhizobium]WJI35763.1 hypothetical protein NL534_17700 [Mesorhizobium opportunistum]
MDQLADIGRTWRSPLGPWQYRLQGKAEVEMEAAQLSELAFEMRARSEFRGWMLLGLGTVSTVYGGLSTLEKAMNDYQQMLSASALLVGMFLLAFVAIYFFFNPSRGSYFDSATGDLVWWKGWTGTYPGRRGHIRASDIGAIHLATEQFGGLNVYLYDTNGIRQADFDRDVLPADYKTWMITVAEQLPHIGLKL